MTNTIKLIANFNSKKQIDWGLLGIIADAFRDEGDELLADYLQFYAQRKSRAFRNNDINCKDPYTFMYANSALAKKIPDHLIQHRSGLFYPSFIFDYCHSVLSFLELNIATTDKVLPDYCLPVTSKMWPGYDCKGKTLSQIKQELSRD